MAIPDAPIITDEDNDLNIFAFTPITGTEISTDNGGTWQVEDSPYNVGRADIPVGELKVRVAEEGGNPVSAETASTIEFTVIPVIETTEVYLYISSIVGSSLVATVTAELTPCTAKYKTDATIHSESKEYTADIDGKITMNLVDTERMAGTCFYTVSFPDCGVSYRIDVPVTTGVPVNFWDILR